MSRDRASEPTGLARIPLMILAWCDSQGIPRASLLEAADLRETDLSDPDARLTLGKIVAMWRFVIERSRSETAGLELGASITPKQAGLVGYTMLHSRTLMEALSRYGRYHRIVTEAIQVTLRESSGRITVELTSHPLLDALVHPIDARLAGLVTVARTITRSSLETLEVRVPYAPTRKTPAHRRILGPRITWEAGPPALVFERTDLERRIVTADSTLTRYLDELAEKSLRSLGQPKTFTDAVRRAVWTDLSAGRPSLARAARHLGVGSRTAQRRLGEEGTSYREVLESLRRELAPSLLRSRELAVYEVAYLLGYSEPSTFHRAFRRWHGESPKAFRNRLGAA